MARFAAVVAATLLVSCYSGPGVHDARMDPGYGSLYPEGVVTPSEKHRGYMPSGIFASTKVDDPYCCWIGGRASFLTVVPANAGALVVQLYVPDYPFLSERPESATISVGKSVATFKSLPIGTAVLKIPIAPMKQPSSRTVEIRMAYTWSPKEQGVNGDTRQLSVYLKRVRAIAPPSKG